MATFSTSDSSGSTPAPTKASLSETPDPPGSAPALQPPPQVRRKRNQVARACESCRVHRLKCNDHYPCSNCTKRGVRCNNSGASKLSTLPQAHREIEALRQKVEALELDLKNARSIVAQNAEFHQETTPTSLPPSRPGGYNGDVIGTNWELLGRASKSWNGIHIRTARSQQTTWFGPSSLFCFIGRVSTYLRKSLHLTHPAVQMLPDSASKRLFAPVADSETDISGFGSSVSAGDSSFTSYSTSANYLSSTQEEYFLDLYWQTYHVVYPVFSEADFKEHYQSLWAAGASERKPSALVEIVIALCLQYGMALSPNAVGRSAKAHVDNDDATIAGRWYYQRCQVLLATELETPTLATLQCHILCSIYLCCGSFINMADGACALAVRTAYMIGLHLDPPTSMPQPERELRRRVWWTLYVLESKMSMKLGRPFLMHGTDSTCALPADHPEIAAISGSSFSRLGAENATWLTFSQYNIKLLLIARTAHTSLYEGEARSHNSLELPPAGDDMWQDPDLLESFAKAASANILRLAHWAEVVPAALRTTRRFGGNSMSTDLSPLAIEQFAPLWIQRQRLLLELMYHNLSSNLCRPFIYFGFNTATPEQTATADRLAAKCAVHAVSLTRIMYQVLSETTILNGWHEAFQWQWNSAVTLVGFVLSQPRVEYEEAVMNARTGIDLAVAVLEKFGESFAVANSAAGIIKNLSGILATGSPNERSPQMVGDVDPVEAKRQITDTPYETNETVIFHGHDVQRMKDDELVNFNGHEWSQDGMMANPTVFNFDDKATAALLAELGQSVNSMLGVEAHNFFDEDIDPPFINSINALPQDWAFA